MPEKQKNPIINTGLNAEIKQGKGLSPREAVIAIQKYIKSFEYPVPFDMLVSEAEMMVKALGPEVNIPEKRHNAIAIIKHSVKTGDYTTAAGLASAIQLSEQELKQILAMVLSIERIDMRN